MRNLLGLSVVLLVSVALSSCGGNRPEKGFMGTWEGAVEDEEIAELSFMENNIFTYTSNEMEKTIAGTWTINPEGNAVMVVDGEDEKAIATLVNDEKMILQGESTSNAAVFEKIDKKN